MMVIRSPLPDETVVLAQVWFDAWHDAHAPLVPADLTRQRTLEAFHLRLKEMLDLTRVAGPVGAPVGLCIIREDEIDHLFLARAARGTGVAAQLLADGEARIAATGVRRAWLGCAIGNDRAARFYEKHGWRREGIMIHHAETPVGVFPLETWRYEKDIVPTA